MGLLTRQRHGQAVCILFVAVVSLLPQASLGNADVCHGFDEMWGLCPQLPSCEECMPVDCQFGDWGYWFPSETPCTGLKYRERTVAVVNNECGMPCSGPKIESVQDVPNSCLLTPVDCQLSDWSQWSECEAEVGQIYRKRQVISAPTDGGLPCAGTTHETRPCGGGPPPEPCLFTDWQEWTACSATCGMGRHTRMRRVQNEAKHSGNTCLGNTLETATCHQQACGGVDCALSDWGDWSMCDPEGHPQRYRRREVAQAGTGSGLRCNETLKETAGCPEAPQQPCKLSEWTEWTALGWREPNPPKCNKECGGGQAFRTRTMQAPPKHGGSCPGSSLRELKACNEQPCNSPCELSDWSAWTTCSAECGKGTMTRKRALANPSAWFSEGCQGALEEALPCIGAAGACPHSDCLWSQWNDWSECSASCNGGLRHRNRMISQMPTGGGAACEAMTKREAQPCNTKLCGFETCTDGQWGEWQDWEPCTATCSSSFTVRRRSIAAEPNHCGRPAAGTRHEYKACSHLPACTTDKDCQLSDWSEWSACSATCYGVHERNRYIQVFQSGNGKRCDMNALKETAPCNPELGAEVNQECKAPGPTDCQLGFWNDWTACTKSCGGGQRERRRKVLALPMNGGKPCDGELNAIGPCNPQPCELEVCTDCQWGTWSEWGDCDKCNGQKYRHRSIEQMPNHCGRMCDLQSAKEVTNCTGKCEAALVCAWTEWSEPFGCGTGCGDKTMMRSRALSLHPSAEEFLFTADHTAKCLGAQLDMSLCPDAEPCDPPCVPQDCVFADWGAWSPPTAAGLCERHRSVAVSNNECGMPCQGVMGETKRCIEHNADRQDCSLSEWAAWTDCMMNGKAGQRHRQRVVSQAPTFDGTPCAGSLSETEQCHLEPLDCALSEWDEWGECHKSCGGGWHTRHRKVLNSAAHGGKLCQDSLQEMRLCNVEECVELMQDCFYSDWSSWSGCGDHGQRYRDRKVASYAIGKGQACEGQLEETRSCLEDDKVDCVVSDWTSWDDCDKPCGGGQSQRQRQIMVFPENGGMECPSDLIQTRGCNQNPCNVQDCQVSDWQEWAPCSASCGPAYTHRSREVLHLRNPAGIGCSLELTELAACSTEACFKAGCLWGQWQEWSACQVSCGGGQQSRSREVSQLPEIGGEMCEPADKEEVRPCATQSCTPPPCQDGLWGDWAEWSPCSASCTSGTSFRTRSVAQMANFCGQPVAGPSHETRVCNLDVQCEPSVDCVFSDWGVWSDCSQTCSGVMKRSRQIEQYGSGQGAFCEGHLKETSPCNPTLFEPTPAECTEAPPVDCVLSEWSGWGECSASCGGGEHVRSREVLTPPANGGKACEGSLTLARQCGADKCPGPEPEDCLYGEWQEWGACAKCDGQRTRFRHVVRFPKHGGKACEPFDAEEASACPRRCHEKQYCAWGDWAAWGDCTSKCGEGKRMRRRYLALTAVPSAPPAPADDLLEMYSNLKQQTVLLQSSQTQELVLAFAGGFMCFVVTLTGVRVFFSVRSRRQGGGRELLTGPSEDHQHSREDQAAQPLVADA